MGTGWSWLRIGRVAGTCGYDEEISGSKNAGNFLTSGKVYLVSFSRRALLHGVSM